MFLKENYAIALGSCYLFTKKIGSNFKWSYCENTFDRFGVCLVPVSQETQNLSYSFLVVLCQ